MILDLINYSLDQPVIDFDIEKVDQKLIKINQEENKFIICINEIKSSGKGRKNPFEKRIQISPRIKRLLIENEADDYKPVLLGYDKETNTFTFWKFDIYIETNTMQSFYTRSQNLKKAQSEGCDIYFFRRRQAFNRGIVNERNQALSVNAFLFPLVLKNYNQIFNRNILEIFNEKIRSWNKPYTRDELILCLDLYFKKYPISRNSPEILEISNFCCRNSDLKGFVPRKKFYHDDIAKNFRNFNGISRKLENIDSGLRDDLSTKHLAIKDTIKKGVVPDKRAIKILKENYIIKSKILDKNKLSEDAKLIKDKIISNDINFFVGNSNFVKVSKEKTKNKIQHQDEPNILLKFDLNHSYTDRTLNLDKISDPIEKHNALNRATKLHEEVLMKLAKKCESKGLPTWKSIHIDLYTEYQNRGKLFEVKTFDKSNLDQQIRHGIIQLKEYYFRYAMYNEEILKSTDLFLLLNDNPEGIIKSFQIRFLKDQNITLCWIQNNKIVTFKKDKWSNTRPAIKWLL